MAKLRPCLNCGNRKTKWRKRGLCQPCYKIPKIRKKFSPLSTPKGGAPRFEVVLELDDYFMAQKKKKPPKPTKALPLTEEKIKEMARRAALGQPLCVSGDADIPD